ncbi:MAG: hypothetical protein ACK4NS_11775 [Saprospiraceae bacterium]
MALLTLILALLLGPVATPIQGNDPISIENPKQQNSDFIIINDIEP